jgi:hypothetical protein
MSWDWSSPIALGLFLLMVGGAVVLVGVAVAVVSAGGAKVMAVLPGGSRRRR